MVRIHDGRISMPHYRNVGCYPPKRHVYWEGPDGSPLVEELLGDDGFDGESSLLYHLHDPAGVEGRAPWEPPSTESDSSGLHAAMHFPRRPAPVPGAAADAVRHRVMLVGGATVRVWRAVATAASPLYRNATADECAYVEAGKALVHTAMGSVEVGPGDFVVIPAGVVHSWHPSAEEGSAAVPAADPGRRTSPAARDAASPLRLTLFESAGRISAPARYLSPHGLLLEGSPYCERDLRHPDAPQAVDAGDTTVLTRHGHRGTAITYRHHPFDVVGWTGTLYPYVLNIADCEPVTARLHAPPPVHQIFAMPGADLMFFTPRLLEYHPQAVKVPYQHVNLGGDELLLFADGDFSSRTQSGVRQGSVTVFPPGIPHGPPPGLAEATHAHQETSEWTLLLDGHERLEPGRAALPMLDAGYPLTW
ncbi:cupin domain-containing protein [Streptomyces erythrochromogenes]|uniref:cupin domain-containing protein n=1 Tax=Streptomyces erythrochromogenes TaxID=285574 RepID=UPI00369DB3CF